MTPHARLEYIVPLTMIGVASMLPCGASMGVANAGTSRAAFEESTCISGL